MFFDFKDYLNDPKKIIGYNLDYNYSDFNSFNYMLEESFGFILNNSDFDLFIEKELENILDKRIYWGNTSIELSKQKIKECIIKHSLTHDFNSTVNTIRQWANGYNLYYIIPVYGILIHNEIHITDNISLISSDILPCCRLKMDMIKRRKENQSYAECFLKIKIGNYRILDKSDKEGYLSQSNKYFTDFETTTKALKYIFPLLPVIVGAGCIPYHEAIFFIDGFYYDNYSIIEAPDFLKRMQNTNYKYICIINDDDIRNDIVNKYFSLPDKIKNDLVPAFEYYNKYLLCKENQYADAAIFLRIALETLLLDGYGKKKFQVSHRAAYLLNTDIGLVHKCSDNGFKREVYRFSALYSMTSTFVHGDESYDSSSIGFGYTTVSQGFLSGLLPSIRKLFINYIDIIINNLHQIVGKEYYNDFIFKNTISSIKNNSVCNEKICIESDENIIKFINELLVYEESNEYSKDRYMLFKLFNDKLAEKIYNYKSGFTQVPDPFKDLASKPANFDGLRESSKRFITAALSHYYCEIGYIGFPSWISNYVATIDDIWINLNDEVVSSKFDFSNIAKHFADRKLFPTAMSVSN